MSAKRASRGRHAGAFFALAYACVVFSASRPELFMASPRGVAVASLGVVVLAAGAVTFLASWILRAMPEAFAIRGAAVVTALFLLGAAERAVAAWLQLPALGPAVRVLVGVLTLACVLLVPLWRRWFWGVFLDAAEAAWRYHRPVLALAAGAVPLGLADAALGKSRVVQTGSASVPSVAIVILDGLSAAHVDLPGLPGLRRTTPQLAEMAQRGTVYSRAFTASTATATSIQWLLTGRFMGTTSPLGYAPVPSRWRDSSVLHQAARAGYGIGYVSSAPSASLHSMWVRVGIDWEVHTLDRLLGRVGPLDFTWVVPPLSTGLVRRWARVPPARSLAAATETARRLAERGPFLLVVHVLAPHEPYLPDPADVAVLASTSRRPNAYDAYVRTVDRMVSAWIHDLWRVAPRALVVLVSDHGLRGSEGFLLRRETVHVPVIVLEREGQGKVDSALISLAEVWPRVLAPRIPALVPGGVLRPPVVELGGIRALLVQRDSTMGVITESAVCAWTIRSLAPPRCEEARPPAGERRTPRAPTVLEAQLVARARAARW